MMNKEEFYSKTTLSKTLFLDRVDGDVVAQVQNKLNETDGVQVVATTIEPVICIGSQGATSGKFFVWIYYKALPNIKLDIDKVFIQKPKEAQSLLK